jgi:hypothetical protein
MGLFLNKVLPAFAGMTKTGVPSARGIGIIYSQESLKNVE